MTGDFIIEESGNVCCFGKIRTKDANVLNVQHMIGEQIDNKDFEVVLNSNDIYKDLRALGYDYGPKFQKVVSVKTNDFQTIEGQLEWDGNWVTFIDSLLQTMIAVLAFRKMMVPVMIKWLRCDPKVLFEAIDANRVIEEKEETDPTNELEKRVEKLERGDDSETTDLDIKLNEIALEQSNIEQMNDEMNVAADNNKVSEIFGKAFREQYRLFKSIIPFRAELISRLIIAPGVEVEDIFAFPIPRKFSTQVLKTESYEFLANEDMMAVEECDKKEVFEYIKV